MIYIVWAEVTQIFFVAVVRGGEQQHGGSFLKKMVTLIQNSRPVHTSPIMRI